MCTVGLCRISLICLGQLNTGFCYIVYTNLRVELNICTQMKQWSFFRSCVSLVIYIRVTYQSDLFELWVFF